MRDAKGDKFHATEKTPTAVTSLGVRARIREPHPAVRSVAGDFDGNSKRIANWTVFYADVSTADIIQRSPRARMQLPKRFRLDAPL